MDKIVLGSMMLNRDWKCTLLTKDLMSPRSRSSLSAPEGMRRPHAKAPPPRTVGRQCRGKASYKA